ncbi:ribokinase [Rhizobium sp. CF142]|uniref:ribokinase n=1 Tax=Rhizobium sp. CF142 TaxID=1144314 RepID=UPI00026EFF26|nr:ribokinase [Rhizobium sp. CF142]EJJ28082.1 sugar kinase, ribokinase [Rhizobium sp. CF142]
MITVLGSINMDLVATTERLPRAGETVAGKCFATSAGGKGANQALAAKLSGSAVRMVGAVGDDSFAAGALSMLRSASVDVSGVKTMPSATGTAIILVDTSGENMITIIAGANSAVDTDMADEAVAGMTSGDLLMLQMEIPAQTVEHALKAARRKGITTIFNTAPFTADVARLAAFADIVVSNETEFDLLVGSTLTDLSERHEALLRLHRQNGQTFVLTLGADGVMAAHNGEITQAKSLKIEPVDTVGAGDTFCGYLAGSLEQGLDLKKALRRAAVAGSLACLATGAQAAIPDAGCAEKALA